MSFNLAAKHVLR